MRKLLMYVFLVVPICVSAQNLIYNPGFDMTPWNAGWIKNLPAIGSIEQCDTTYYSVPRSCKIYVYVNGSASGSYGYADISQSMQPAVSCTCKVMLKYKQDCSDTPNYDNHISVYLVINGKDTKMWDKAGTTIYEGGWGLKEKIYTDNDTISGIKFSVYVVGPDHSGVYNSIYLWIDDVSIMGKVVPGVEEENQNSSASGGLKSQISIYPNPFVKTTNIRLQDSRLPDRQARFKINKIQIYDVSGKLVEETKDNTIGKNLKPGIYFVKVGNYNPVKIIKLRK